LLVGITVKRRTYDQEIVGSIRSRVTVYGTGADHTASANQMHCLQMIQFDLCTTPTPRYLFHSQCN